jgi:hypothetical protein
VLREVETSWKKGKRYVCQFIPARLGGTLRVASFVTASPLHALGAFVHLDVPDREAGCITISDEAGALLVSEAWPPTS